MSKVLSLSWFRHSSSGYETEAAGAGRGVFFVGFLQAVMRAWHHSMSGWELRIYHDDRVREFPYFKVLERLGVLVPMGEAKTLCGSMMWRMSPAFDPSVEAFACRDVDSLPMPRDRRMLEEFLAGGYAAHTILDSESHCGPFMGGMVAFNSEKLRTALGNVTTHEEMLKRFPMSDPNRHGNDQEWLNINLWPRLSDSTLIHQRREDVLYPSAGAVRRVLPQECDEDRLANHIGGAFEAEKVARWYDEHHPWPMLQEIERSVGL